MKTSNNEKRRSFIDYEECDPDEVAMKNDDGLDEAVDLFGRGGRSLWIIFILVSIPGIFNIWHLTSYVFLGAALEHWCDIPELKDTNWTNMEIRNISIPKLPPLSADVLPQIPADGCSAYAWNYSAFSQMTFNEAWATTGFTNKTYDDPKNSTSRPTKVSCSSWSYEGEGHSIMSEWDLVCDREALRSTAQMFVALGKFLGALAFGFIADKWGRKNSVVLSCFIYIIAGPLAAFAPWYSLFVFARLMLGMAGSGTYNCGFTLLSEVCAPKLRMILGILFNMTYPIGMLILPLIAYFEPRWRMLSLALSVPAVVLLAHFWLLPESPKWLISQGRRKEAWDIVKHVVDNKEYTPGTQLKEPFKDDPKPMVKSNAPAVPWYRRIIASMSMGNLGSLFGNAELRNRLIICHYAWCVTAMTYFALSLNADNFSADRYVYVAIAGAVEAVSYVMPIPMLKWMGRRLTSGILYLISGAALLSIIAIPKDEPLVILIVAMIGRLCIGAVYSVIVLHTSELFPTVNRNTAVGTSSTMSHVGSLAAPYLVDLLGKVAWYIPSTVCGAASLIAGMLVMMLPETKDKELCNTVEEVMQRRGKDRVSFNNCFSL